MSMLDDIEALKKPRAEITVVGADFELAFVPPVGATIKALDGSLFTVDSVDIILAQGSDPALVTVNVS